MGKKAKQEVLLPYDFLPIFEKLAKSGKEKAAAELVIAIIRYDRDGMDPVFEDEGVGFVWDTVIKPKLDENKRAYEEVGEKRRAAVNSRYKNKGEQVNTNVHDSIQNEQMNTNVHDNDNDNDNLNNIYNNNYSESTSSEPVDNVDNSPKSVDNSNAQPGPDNSRAKSLDGLDLYSLPGKDAFAIFREEYPRRQGALREVQTAWVTAVAGGALPGDLVMAGRKYARVCSEEHTEQKYIKMPQNFISSGLWKQYAPKYLPSCPHCHGQGVYQGENGMIMCECNRRYG